MFAARWDFSSLPRVGVALAVAALIVGGCGAPAAQPAAQSSASGGAAAPAKPAGGPSAQAPAASTSSPEWDRMVAEAKKEGTVRVVLPPGIPGIVDAYTKAFEDEFGIDMEASGESSRTAQVRIEQEAGAGKQSTDVLFGGASEMLNLYPKGLLAPIPHLLVRPEVANMSNWAEGRIKWVDDAQQYLLRTSDWVNVDLVVNGSMIDPRTITSWRDLLKPEYRGKIIGQDPRFGAGGATARQLLEAFGPDYVKALYLDQQVTLSRDEREVVQAIARGTHPVGIALFPSQIEAFKKEGFNLVRVFPTDGVPAILSGTGVVKLIKDAPHPNAAAVFINWYASKKAQEIYSDLALEPTRRVDVDLSRVPDYVRPKPGVQYRDQYTEDYYLNIGPKMLTQIEELVGR
jgi:ABC-type Fe3+ transport system substrate-binding protein